MTDLVEFLLARIGEDEAVAKDAALTVGWDGFGDSRIRSGQHWTSSYHVVKRVRDEGPADRRTVADCGSFVGMDTAPHIARWDPARVLAECEAKREIVDRLRHVETGVLLVAGDMTNYRSALLWAARALATAYADHPDYEPEWAVTVSPTS